MVVSVLKKQSEFSLYFLQLSQWNWLYGCVKEQNGREASETIGHSRGNRVLMPFIAAFSHLHCVETLIR